MSVFIVGLENYVIIKLLWYIKFWDRENERSGFMSATYKKSEILKKIDYTLLKPTVTADDYRKFCEEVWRNDVAAVCVPPAWVRFCRSVLPVRAKVCTVVGFPLGYNDPEVKAYEARWAVANGANEIDMVINIGRVLSASPQDTCWMDMVKDEIGQVRRVCDEQIILKVITENCYLNEAQKISLCQIVTDAGADYIKTSTGFGSGGATLEDVKLFRNHVGPNVRIKAAGGISTIEDAIKFIEAGADRIGSSKIVDLLVEDDRIEYTLD